MSSTDQSVQVYQLRIWIRGISPQIWRRLLVASASTLAATFQRWYPEFAGT